MAALVLEAAARLPLASSYSACTERIAAGLGRAALCASVGDQSCGVRVGLGDDLAAMEELAGFCGAVRKMLRLAARQDSSRRKGVGGQGRAAGVV